MSAEPDSLVHAVVGKLGSGKTFYAVIRAAEALMQGRVVVSNVEFNWPAMEGYCRRMGARVPRENYRFVSSEELERGGDVLRHFLCEGAFVLLDEIHLFMDARKYRENAAKSGWFQELLTQARKYRLDVWLVSQSAANVDAQLIRQCTYIVRVSNWLHLPVLGTLFPLPYTIARTCAPDGRTVYSRDWIFRSSKIGRLYDTRQKFKELGLQGNAAMKVIGQKRRKAGYGVVLVAVGLILLALDWFLDRERYDALAEYEKQNPQPQRVESSAATSAAAAPVGPVATGPLDYDTLLRIEASLPGWSQFDQRFIHFEDGSRIEIGSAVGCGYVRAWMLRHAGRIVLLTDSPLTPEISIFHYDNKPYRHSTAGTPAGLLDRHSVRGPSVYPPQAGGLGGVLDKSGNGALGDAGPQGFVPQYAPPPAVVVPTVGLPTRLPANPWLE